MLLYDDYPATAGNNQLRSSGNSTERTAFAIDEKVDKDTKKLLKRLKILEEKGFVYKESKTSKERNRRIQEKINLRLKETYIKRYKNGEISLNQLPKNLFPELFQERIILNDRPNWKKHIHHHIRCELMDGGVGINVFCHTCSEEVEGKLITTFYKSDEDFIKFFRSGNRKNTRSHPFYKCNYCKCQISIKNFYKTYQMFRCPNCESHNINKMREIEVHDRELFKLLSERERLKLELQFLIEEKTKRLKEFDYLDSRQVITCKNPKIDKREYHNEMLRRRTRIVLKDSHILTNKEIISKLREEEKRKREALPKYEKSRWEEKKIYKKRGRKLKI